VPDHDEASDHDEQPLEHGYRPDLPTYRLLGPPAVRVDGSLRLCQGPRQTVLLSILALSPGTPVDSSRLYDALWPGAPPHAPANALQSQVSRLRRLVGVPAVQLVNRGYVLQAGRADVDATLFEDGVARARRLLAAGAYVAARSAVASAEDLWRGEPMADVQDDQTIMQAADRLAELRMDGAVVRVEAEIALGLHAQAVAPLRSLLEQHPLREDLWALLVTALYRCGRTADALVAHRRARGVLVRELGLDPGPRLRDLERDILGRAPHLSAPPHPCAAHAALLAGHGPADHRGDLPPAAGPLGPPAGWADYPAPKLFLDRLQLSHPHRVRPAPDTRQAGDIVTLCRLLDGDPLAIELAASSLEAVGLEGLPSLLSRHLRAAVRPG
jgi:DNA-binding SARP family transcriptional activator